MLLNNIRAVLRRTREEMADTLGISLTHYKRLERRERQGSRVPKVYELAVSALYLEKFIARQNRQARNVRQRNPKNGRPARSTLRQSLEHDVQVDD